MSSGEQTPKSTKSTPSISRAHSSGTSNGASKESFDVDRLSSQLNNLRARSGSVPASTSGPLPISGRGPCLYGVDCRNSGCWFEHPGRETDIVYGRAGPSGNLLATNVCRDGIACTDAGCRRAHPNRVPGSTVTVRGYCVHACMHHCTGMLARGSGKVWIEPKCHRHHLVNCERFHKWHRDGKTCAETHRDYLLMIQDAVAKGIFLGEPPAEIAELSNHDNHQPRRVVSERTLGNWIAASVWKDEPEEPDDEDTDDLISVNGTASSTSSACSVTSVIDNK